MASTSASKTPRPAMRRILLRQRPTMTKQTLSRWTRGDGPTTAAGTWRWLDLQVPIPPILTTAEHAAWIAWLREATRPAQRHTAYLLGGRVRTPCGRYFHGRTAGRKNPLYVCRHHLTTPAGDPERCGCISIRSRTPPGRYRSVPDGTALDLVVAGHEHHRRRDLDARRHRRRTAERSVQCAARLTG